MSFRATPGFTDHWEHLHFAVSDGVGTITLDRPERLNALTLESYADLRDLLGELEHRDDVSVVVITGAGDRGFCSGGDVHEIIGELLERGDNRQVLEFTRMTGAVIQRMRELPKPIIAAVNGTAAGAGAVIALAADLRVCASTASFRFLFTQVGLAGADMGCAYLLPRVVGLGRATEMLLFGDRVGAEEAERIGLANRVVAPEDLDEAVEAWARRLAEGPTFAYGATKSLLTREQDLPLQSAIELEAWTQAMLMRSGDHREFYDAFRAGRDPEWTGR
jgi:enoyl-CoA hydratase/carnithine racemase